jgi:hypothetical protein
MIFYPLFLAPILRFSRSHRPSALQWVAHLRHAPVSTHLGGKSLPEMNNVSPGITTDNKDVKEKAPSPIRANSDFVSNEINESDLQCEKQDKQRI